MTLIPIDYSSIVCCDCGITFFVPTRWLEERKSDHTNFECPNKHTLHFSELSDNEKLQKEVKSLSRSLSSVCDDRDMCFRRIAAQKGATTKLRNKLAEKFV